MTYEHFMREAFTQAKKSYDEGGLPIGEAQTFTGNIDFLRSHNVEVTLLNDADCIELMSRFIRERPDLWDEDIAGSFSV